MMMKTEDGIFFAKGIGSSNTGASMPILYRNLGKTFANAPVLYGKIPDSLQAIDWKQAYYHSLRLYAQEMTRKSERADKACGIDGYVLLISS